MDSRAVLKTFFLTGEKPTQGQFADLIDSCFNLEDDTITIPDVSGLSAALALKAAATDITALTARVLPAGGTAGQVLSKIDATDYNTQWVTDGSGSNIYNTDGTLTANRTVTLGGKFLGFEDSSNLANVTGLVIVPGEIAAAVSDTTAINTPTGNFLISNAGVQFGLSHGSGDSFASNINITAAGLVVKDQINSVGLQEFADYSANYTARNYISKGYADATYALAGGGSVNIYNTDGSLTSNRTVNTNTNYLEITSDSGSTYYYQQDGQGISLNAYDGARYSTLINVLGPSTSFIGFTDGTTGYPAGFNFGSSSGRFSFGDQANEQGLPYEADYSVNGIANFGDRWIGDVGYTKSLILAAVPSQTGNSGKYLTTNGTSTSWATVGLGYTAENVANKATTLATLNNALYPTTQAVANYVTGFSYLTTIAGITAAGDLSGTYASPTVLNSAVIGKVLTGLSVVTGGAIAATDSILGAFGKLQNQVSANTSNFSNYLPLTGGALTGFLTLSADPTSALHAATKNYVDNIIIGVIWVGADMATTGNITLSGEQTIDTVTTSTSRVFVKNQSTASQNGIYISNSGAWIRSADATTGAQVIKLAVIIEGGTQKSQQWVNTNSAVTIGTTNITFSQSSGIGTYTNGTGILLSGTAFSLDTSYTGSLYASLTGSYSNPSWIASLAYSKLTGAPTNVSSFTNDSNYLTTTGSAALLTSFPTLNQNTTGNAATVTTNANLTGDVTSVGNATTIANISALPGGAGVAAAATASTLVARDSSANLAANSFLPGYTTTVSSGTTITLTVASTEIQVVTGTTAQTMKLPVASTLVLGQRYRIINQITQSITIQTSGGNTLSILPTNVTTSVVCILASGTGVASWIIDSIGPQSTTGASSGALVFSNFPSIGGLTSTNTVTLSRIGTGAAVQNMLLLNNTSAATSGTPIQYSLAQSFNGAGWNTSGTPASNTVAAQWILQPTSGSTVTGNLMLGFNINGAGNTNAFQFQSGGNFVMMTGFINWKAFIVSGLPSASTAVGCEGYVTDATSPAIGSTVVGGGSAKAKVWSNGTNWTVTGI